MNVKHRPHRVVPDFFLESTISLWRLANRVRRRGAMASGAMAIRRVRNEARRGIKGLEWRMQRRRVAARVEPLQPYTPVTAKGPLIIAFAPEGGFGPAHVAQSVVTRILQEQGENVLFVRCFSVFKRCPVMDIYQLDYGQTPKTRRDTCLRCAAAASTHIDAYGLRTLDLRAFVTPEIAAAAEIALSNAPDDLREFVFDGIALGKLCASDVCRKTKVADLSHPPPDVRAAWLDYITGAVTSYLLVSRLCQLLPVSRLIHFNDYPIMLSARVAAERAGVRVVGLTLASHLNVDYRRYVFLDRPWAAVERALGEQWPRWRELALPPQRVREISDDSMLRFRGVGSHIYSPAKTFSAANVRTHLGLSMDKKLLVAFTSSQDEVTSSAMYMDALGYPAAVTTQTFGDQIAWISALVAHVERHEELQLVVRVHPREGANHREGVESQYLSKLKNAFGDTMARCRFVWPGDPVSSYDLGESADVALVSWSSLGPELSRLGVPVLASTAGIAIVPDGDFIEFRATTGAYFEALDDLLNSGASLQRIAYSYRWYNLSYLGTGIDLGDLIPHAHYAELPLFAMPREAAVIRDIVAGDSDPLSINRQRLERNQPPASAERERAALRAELRRIIHFLFTGQQVDTVQLTVTDESTPASSFEIGIPEAAGKVVVRGAHVAYDTDGRVFRRFSPMIARLASLCVEEGPVTGGRLCAPTDSATASTY